MDLEVIHELVVKNDTKINDQVKAVIDRIRPMLQADGGDI